MQLKLAEYKDGKFGRFLELGSDGDDKFAFAGNSIILDAASCSCGCCKGPQHFEKDEKDPLNRFNGLFDGRTYGEGRFVLIVDDEDNVENIGIDGRYSINTAGFAKEITNSYVFIGQTLGNLHENPELWEKVK